MNLNVPINIHNAFKASTAAQGREMTPVVLELIQKYIDKHPPTSKGRRK